MDNNVVKMQFIQKCIEHSYNFAFENVSNFILRLTHPNYYSTRPVYDGKVDGIIYNSKRKRSFYSIYGPEKHDWKKKDKYKIDQDAEGIKEFLSQHQIELYKWYFVINRELSVNEIEYIKMKFNDPKKVDIITPSKFIELITKRDVVLETARFLNLLQYDVPLIDLQPHAFLKHALDLLVKMKYWSKEDTLKELECIINAVVDLTYMDKEEKLRENKNGNFWCMVRRYTRISKKKLKSFAYYDGKFLELNDLQEKEFTKTQDNHFILTPHDLWFLYRIAKNLRTLIMQNKPYSIEAVLNEMYLPLQIQFAKRKQNG